MQIHQEVRRCAGWSDAMENPSCRSARMQSSPKLTLLLQSAILPLEGSPWWACWLLAFCTQSLPPSKTLRKEATDNQTMISVPWAFLWPEYSESVPWTTFLWAKGSQYPAKMINLSFLLYIQQTCSLQPDTISHPSHKHPINFIAWYATHKVSAILLNEQTSLYKHKEN